MPIARQLRVPEIQLGRYARIVFTCKMMRLERGADGNGNALISIACFLEAACMVSFGTGTR